MILENVTKVCGLKLRISKVFCLDKDTVAIKIGAF